MISRRREYVVTFLKWDDEKEAVDVCDIVVQAKTEEEAEYFACMAFEKTGKFTEDWELEAISEYCSGCGATFTFEDDCICEYVDDTREALRELTRLTEEYGGYDAEFITGSNVVENS